MAFFWYTTRRSNSRLLTPFSNPERLFCARRDTTPTSVYNIFSFYESESSESEYKEMGEVDNNTLIMEQYMTLTRGNQGPGTVRPEIGGNVNFEILLTIPFFAMENANPSSPPDSPTSPIGRRVQELNKLLKSLNIVVRPPLVNLLA
ncbi:hypothetical protein Tco_0706766 [Tanacetum coccineum]|uniref:Uncharacterized protein n=1 Tax=Tanacetum coccineum TaxID=301880 RepID=A0ABQ4Y973_9ASTR